LGQYLFGPQGALQQHFIRTTGTDHLYAQRQPLGAKHIRQIQARNA
jgi:hypothetical protein